MKIHVQHILRKLDLTSRVQAAVYAAERGQRARPRRLDALSASARRERDAGRTDRHMARAAMPWIGAMDIASRFAAD